MNDTRPIPGKERTANARRRNREATMQLKIEVSPIPIEHLIEKEFLKADDEDDPVKVAAALTEYIRIITGDVDDVTTSRVP